MPSPSQKQQDVAMGTIMMQAQHMVHQWHMDRALVVTFVATMLVAGWILTNNGFLGLLLIQANAAVAMQNVSAAALNRTLAIVDKSHRFRHTNLILDETVAAITMAVLKQVEGEDIMRGTFLELGGFKEGKSGTLGLELGFNWQGILLSPNPWALHQLTQEKRAAMLIHGCVSTEKTSYIKNVTLDAKNEVVCNPDAGNGSHHGLTTQLPVMCFPLVEIVKNMGGFQKLDLLYLDNNSNGCDEDLSQIVNTLPFNELDIKVIVIVNSKMPAEEHLDTKDDPMEPMKAELIRNGYQMADEVTGSTHIFTKNN